MKSNLKKFIPESILKKRESIINKRNADKLAKRDYERFLNYSFNNDSDLTYSQIEARLTKEYHSLEKGLSYQDLRYGFGQAVLLNVINLMKYYREKDFPLDSHVYQTALNNLESYISIHKENGYPVEKIEKAYDLLRINAEPNNNGGVFHLTKADITEATGQNFEEFSNSRHSFREFSSEPVSYDEIEKALELAQNTPSACNRQSWIVRVVEDTKLKNIIRKNQNGNRGFGDYIDKIVVITSDVQYYDRLRERNQANIDGGMYAMNLLYSLHFNNIAAVPLSASLNINQEDNIRKALEINDSENFIMFIGIGNFADEFKVPKSSRRPMVYKKY